MLTIIRGTIVHCSLCTYVLHIYIIAQMKANIPEIFGLYFRLFTLNYISLIENNGIISGNEKLSSVFDNGFSNEKTYKHLYNLIDKLNQIDHP